METTESRKGEMAAMGPEGDLKILWDHNRPEEIKAAREQFDHLTKKKQYLAYKVTGDGSKGEIIKEFDPYAERIILAPRMVGG